MSTTHTYAILQISPAAYTEIRDRLLKAGYLDQFHENNVIDMHGIAVQPSPGLMPDCDPELCPIVRCKNCGEGMCRWHSWPYKFCPKCKETIEA